MPREKELFYPTLERIEQRQTGCFQTKLCTSKKRPQKLWVFR